MMKLFRSQNKFTVLVLLGIVLSSLFFNLYKRDVSPPGFNADEAAFGYNAYSIIKTGKDEYGNFLPLRFKSFGENKMPLYAYLSVPSVAIFGLTEDSTRLVNTLVAILLPLTVFFLTKELFTKRIAFISSFLVSCSLGLNILGRHAHESYLATLFIAASLLFFVRFLKKTNFSEFSLFLASLTLALFSAQSSRVFILFYFLVLIFYLLREKLKKSFFILFLIIISLFLLTDLVYKPERVQNLFFAKNLGFSLSINELRGEGGSRFLYNKLTLGLRDVVYQQTKYYSPDFLVLNGDANYRFGFPSMSPVSLTEYLFAFAGLYYLFRKKESWRYLLVFLILITPLSASLSYGDASLTRAIFLLIPLLILASFGFISLLDEIRSIRMRNLIALAIILSEVILLLYSWDFYLNHYPKRAIVIRSWQAGYKELGQYLSQNYGEFKNFYITKENGQPYIYTLFYLDYSPSSYQKQATLSTPDQYGFGQVEKFDKFTFSFKNPNEVPGSSVFIGSPQDFANLSIAPSKKIVVGGQEMFWIYEKP